MEKCPSHFILKGDYGSSQKGLIADLLNGKPPAELEIFRDKKTGFFSDEVLARFIEEDYRHGSSGLTQDRSIRTFSTGEKRKALLEYLMAEHNEVLILDNPFDALDKDSVKGLKNRLEKLSGRISFIQLYKREEDLLPFIEDLVIVENNRITSVMKLKDFSMEDDSLELKNIPEPFHPYNNIPQEVIKLENVSVSYEGRPILKDISWKVEKAEFWQLYGPNGSGKTTILSMIYGDNPKAYGEEIYLFGKKKGSGESVWEIKERIGYFSPSIIAHFRGNFSLQQMIVSGLFDSIGLYREASERQLNLARKWLEVLGLSHKSSFKFYKSSALEQRIVLIARAMIKHPPLLILDEPTTGLDDEAAQLLVQLINKIVAESNTAVIFVSHRKERGLSAQNIFRLIASENGSKGVSETS